MGCIIRSPRQAGVRAASSSLSEAYLQNILAMVMKFFVLIDLIKGECSAYEP